MTAVGNALNEQAGATTPDVEIAANLKELGYGG